MPKAIDLIRRVQRGEAPPPPVAQLIGFTLTAVEPGHAVIAFDADGRHANPMGTLHGGVLCDIADAAMGMAYAATLDANETFTTLELKINFLKPVRTGPLVATGRVVKGGRTIGLVECDVLDDKEQLVARASSTCMTLRGEQAAGRQMPPSVAAVVPSTVALSPRTRLLLEGPVPTTMLRLAAPNVLVMMLQATVSTMDAVFVGWLGSDALAGVALVFPLVMLMQTMSAGGMGGGVASAVARALGGGRHADANALVVHACVIALVMAGCFTMVFELGGPALYHAMGGRGEVLDAAVLYSRVLFGGALAYWLFNTLGSVIRGTGNMAVPASVMVASSVLYIALSPALILGWWPLPRIGIAGAATASVASFTLGSLALLAFLFSRRSLVRPTLRGLRLQPALFVEILRVGAPGSLNTLLTNLTVVVLTSLVGPFGGAALAGYGLGARLEYLQIPIVFGLGSALVTMVGTNVGAGNRARALRVAWAGTAMAAAVTSVIGILAALLPHAWLGLFTADADVLAAGSRYLRMVGPFYGFFGAGLALYFASQGAGRLLWPLAATFTRLMIAGVGGWLATRWLGGGLTELFAAMAVALMTFGMMNVAAVRLGSWRIAPHGQLGIPVSLKRNSLEASS